MLQGIFPQATQDQLNPLLEALTHLSHQFWSSSRLRQSSLHPLRYEWQQILLHKIQKRITNPSQHPPLQIWALGGSIVLGQGAARYHSQSWDLKGNDTLARWSTQWQHLLNHVLGEEVVNITNLAQGGMSTDISILPLKHGLFENVPQPDVIVGAFGYNDLHQLLAKHQNPVLYNLANQDDYLLQVTQDWIRAALGCRNNAAVLLLDDAYLMPDQSAYTNLRHSRVVAHASQYYNVWGISWTNMWLHWSYSRLNETDMHFPLWGSLVDASHPGILFHTGIAWLLLHQFVQSIFLQGCSSSVREHEELLHPRHLPPLMQQGSLVDLYHAWHNASQREQDCSSNTTCAYAWIANRATVIQTREDVKRVVESVMTENEGWWEEGFKIRKPRPGWVTQYFPKAKFCIQVPALESTITKVTIIYLKSYGSKWIHSRLRVTLECLVHSNATSMVRQTELTGFHHSNTSVNYEATMEINVMPGQTVKACFELIKGHAFRINGMLFCQA
jgi:hypothetical protein